MLGDKLRFRFRKSGDLRLLSHHDLMRCLERMLRRAEVPFRSTAGFHPGPRIVFALSLPLGVVGLDEVLELELLRPCDGAEVLARVNAAAPGGLSFSRVAVVPMKASAVPRRTVYRLALPPGREDDVGESCAELMGAEKVWVDRQRPTPKRLNVRPYLRSLSAAAGRLEMDLWVTGTGTARADEIVGLLGLKGLLEAGAVLERTLLEVRDEAATGAPGDGPPDGPAESLPLELAAAGLGRERDEPNRPAADGWGACPNGPVVE